MQRLKTRRDEKGLFKKLGVGKVDSLLWKVEMRGREGKGWSVCKMQTRGAVLLGLQTVISNLLYHLNTHTFNSWMQIKLIR